MRLPLFQVDAFARRRFAGNPAAVCPLPSWLPDTTLQAIAAENNLAETAYFVQEAGGYRIRWFTPSREVDLCGHATLASALVLMDCLGLAEDQVTFQSESGPLTVAKRDGRFILDFPARPPRALPMDASVGRALGAEPVALFASRDLVAVFESEEQVRRLQPDFKAVAALNPFAVVATAPGSDCDFVSRFFAPAAGIDEDPVTGSAHCELGPYWGERLGKKDLFARQLSARGGEIWIELAGGRVKMSGHGVLYMAGFLEVDL
ncbi:MAG: PhzF family phenazine biosynthesis protein [Acidobacteria bacterium]|nr:PhzF family phenazine biosynthesis protein [Acidobacteriota bacterium]